MTDRADPRRLFFEHYACDYDRTLNKDDLARRTEVVFEELAHPADFGGLRLLDAGCATGWLSARAKREGAHVIAVDVGVSLVAAAMQRASCQGVVADLTALPFRDGVFDVVVNAEVIEHVNDQSAALEELGRVIKPGGVLLLTTPNIVWRWVVVLANSLRLRPYKGFERWIGRARLRRLMRDAGLTPTLWRSFNLFWPISHVLPNVPRTVLQWVRSVDRATAGRLSLLALNVGVRAEKGRRGARSNV